MTTYRLEEKKIFTDPTSGRGVIFKIYKELKKLDINKPNNLIKRWGTDLNRWWHMPLIPAFGRKR